MEEVKFFQDPKIEYELLRRKRKVLWIEGLVWTKAGHPPLGYG